MQYSTKGLPPFVAGSAGIAYPKVGPDVAVCIAPCDAVIKRPASWGEGQSLEIKAGTHHIAQDGAGDSYPNMEFDTFYVVDGPADSADPRAAFLVGFWACAFPTANINVQMARKIRPAIVLGVVAPEAIASTFTNHEGTTAISEGGLVLESPDDPSVRWFITGKVFAKKYQPVVQSQ